MGATPCILILTRSPCLYFTEHFHSVFQNLPEHMCGGYIEAVTCWDEHFSVSGSLYFGQLWLMSWMPIYHEKKFHR